jgi:hypothetical protein
VERRGFSTLDQSAATIMIGLPQIATDLLCTTVTGLAKQRALNPENLRLLSARNSDKRR